MSVAMSDQALAIRYLGGPSALIELGGVRFVLDPTFDPPGTYPIGTRALTKTAGPALQPAEIGPVDAVLLSHDQHPDNLDRGGRDFLATAPRVLSTPAAAERLGGNVEGLEPWARSELTSARGATLTVTAMPALHGPEGSESVVGDVTGFALSMPGLPRIYVSGDNASLAHVRTIAERIGPFDVAVLSAGAAQTPLVPDGHLTLTSEEAAEAAGILGVQHVVPLHFEGWAHFSEGADSLRAAFARAGTRERLHLLAPGEFLRL
jgi:L-ascorbate metabolism protein UlaG (beta-lactamase superfamily)